MLNLKQQAATVLVLFHISSNKDVCAAIFHSPSSSLCAVFHKQASDFFFNFPFRWKIIHQVSHSVCSVLMIKGSKKIIITV